MRSAERSLSPPPGADRGAAAARDAGRLAVLAGSLSCVLVAIAGGLDGRVVRWAAALPDDARCWGVLISRLGEAGTLFAVAGTASAGSMAGRVLARSRRARLAFGCMAERAAYVFGVLAVTAGATQVVKQLVGRGRPPVFDQDGAFSLSPFSLTDAYASFPSGHASASFAVAVALSRLAPSLALPLLILSTVIACSRIVVGAHYASDVAAGSAFGVACAVLTTRLFAQAGIAFCRCRGRIVLKSCGAVATGCKP